MSFDNPRAIGAVCKLFRGWHVEVSKGTIEQNVDYCSKEDSRDAGAGFGFVERGSKPVGAGKPGHRSDLQDIAECISGGGGGKSVWDVDPGGYIRYQRGIMAAIELHSKPRDFKTEVFWYYGSTGSGKSRAANVEAPDAYWKSPCDKWWDGYCGQDDVIIDDYRKDMCTFTSLLRLFDRYPLRLEVKGGSVQFRAKRVFVTSPLNPRDTWEGRTEENLAQLERRITKVVHFRVLGHPERPAEEEREV